VATIKITPIQGENSTDQLPSLPNSVKNHLQISGTLVYENSFWYMLQDSSLISDIHQYNQTNFKISKN